MKAHKSGNNIIHRFFRRSRADNSGVSCGILPKYELIQAFMHVLITCRGARWPSGSASDSRARGRGSIPTSAVLCPWARLTPRIVLVIPRKRWLRPDMTEKLFTGTLSLNKSLASSMITQTLMHILITCKYEYKNSREK